MSARQPIASLSLDLDNQWSYMKIHGDPGWEALPSYLETVVPKALALLEEFGLTITFFIVGQDAALEKNHAAIRAIAAAGHEIGNHSFHHESWLHLYSEAEIEREIASAEAAIEPLVGQKLRGFRGPGYSFSPQVLSVLARRGYRYDASTFPSILGPLARAYYFMTARLTAEQRQQRKALFGKVSDGFQPLNPYWWQMGDTTLLEMPVTTMPLFKVPIHFSYILYISVFSRPLALLYFRTALLLCRLTRTQPSLLLHPLDFLGGDDLPELGFFPAMGLPGAHKLETLRRCLALLTRHFSVVPVGQHADLVATARQLPQRPLDLPLANAL
ncbi:polysaccharide deacetylase family protein [Nodosilinea sp. PGN35]|uniref:polysaccharide deacetylase family protein n=1 Tax=Nodosilinea sp. PGN35 TaxID=3020489 RepID=UPI0023B2792A|nr:polysaccharide deacetylase family protein [Nodosilinea sp. TSF1-S3]MDF0367018.1 polysaccharide deacetylase family protein [Nodosilinea sp. TSF1-S3]